LIVKGILLWGLLKQKNNHVHFYCYCRQQTSLTHANGVFSDSGLLTLMSMALTLSQETPPRLGVGDDEPPLGTQHHPTKAEDEHDLEDVAAAPSSPKKNKKKRDANTLRKAPQAPRRFKSSYIMFFTAKQDETKAELKLEAEASGKDVAASTTVTEVSKRSAEKWRNLSPEERGYWEDEAAKDKQRYMREKAAYTGPWQVPWKRAKKDPSAPKRPMSAFLYFSQDRRKKIKAKNPGMKNTEVSQVLGEMWRNASDEEKRPHMEIEERERAKYKIQIAKWNEEKKARDEAQKKAQEEQQRQYMHQMGGGGGAMSGGAPASQGPPPPPPQGMPYAMPPHQGAPPPSGHGSPPMQGDPSQQQNSQHPPHPSQQQGYDPNMMYQQQPQPYGMPPPNAPYYMYPPPPHGYYAPYPPQSGQPVVLGPNGMPQGAPQPPQPQSNQQTAPPPQHQHQHQHQHHMYGPPPPQAAPVPPSVSSYPSPYGTLPPQQEQQSQQQQQPQMPQPMSTPPHGHVFEEDGSNGGMPHMAYPPHYPEPEQMMGGLMPYPQQE